jgi:hypothetical protein
VSFTMRIDSGAGKTERRLCGFHVVSSCERDAITEQASQPFQAVARRRVLGDVGNQNAALADLRLHETRGTLVTVVGVLVKDSAMVLTWVFTALEHQAHQGAQLGVGVVGIVGVSRGLW